MSSKVNALSEERCMPQGVCAFTILFWVLFKNYNKIAKINKGSSFEPKHENVNVEYTSFYELKHTQIKFGTFLTSTIEREVECLNIYGRDLPSTIVRSLPSSYDSVWSQILWERDLLLKTEQGSMGF